VRTTEPIPGVTRFWFPRLDNNAYLIAGDEPTLIDCGPSADLGRLASTPRPDPVALEVRHVAVTHCHTDHTGGLSDVIRATGATVYAHRSDAGIIRDGAERRRGVAASRTEPSGASGSCSPGARAAQIPRPFTSRSGMSRCFRRRGAPVHPHTWPYGRPHVAPWPGAGGVPFVGDAAANMFRRLAIAPINEDNEAALASFRRLAELEFEHACFGHGSPIRAGAASRFRRTLQRIVAR
jgi:Metallo-beta-lactamase superfamily